MNAINYPPAPWVPGCEGSRCFSNADGQVSRGSETQVSASMVLESRAENPCVPTHQEGSQDLGCPRVAMKIH